MLARIINAELAISYSFIFPKYEEYVEPHGLTPVAPICIHLRQTIYILLGFGGLPACTILITSVAKPAVAHFCAFIHGLTPMAFCEGG